MFNRIPVEYPREDLPRVARNVFVGVLPVQDLCGDCDLILDDLEREAGFQGYDEHLIILPSLSAGRLADRPSRGVECDYPFPIPDEYLCKHVEHIASHVAGTVASGGREK